MSHRTSLRRLMAYLGFSLLALFSQLAFAKFATCPGSQMILSCGNLKCDRWLGEDLDTCPSDCGRYPAASYNFQKICLESNELETPANQEELIDTVKTAVAAGRQVKVVGRLHSTNSVICNSDLLITTQKLDHVLGLEIFQGQEVVRAEAGVTMGQLADWLHDHGKSLGYTLMGFRGISIAGAVGTGAHGSSPHHPSVFATLIESFKMLEADGKLVEYSRQDTEANLWKALSTNLGLLGVVLELRVRVQPQFLLEQTVDFLAEDKLWTGAGSWSLIENCDFAQMMWFPGARKLMRMCGKETTQRSADAGARIALVDYKVPAFIFPTAKAFVHEGACNQGAMCLFEKIRVQDIVSHPPMRKLKGKREIAVANVTGFSHRLMAGDLSTQGAHFFQNDWALAIPVRRLDAALIAMRKHFTDFRICLPFSGVFLRYGQVTDVSWLAHSAAGTDFVLGEPVVFIDMVYYNPMGYSVQDKAAYEKPYDELMKLLMDSYGARLHWGKNKDWALEYEMKAGHLATQTASFLDVVNDKDPKGVFANASLDILRLGLKKSEN